VTFPFFFKRKLVPPHFLQMVGTFPVFPLFRALQRMQMYIFLNTRAIASGNLAINNPQYTPFIRVNVYKSCPHAWVMPKRTGSRAKAKSRNDLDDWIARGKPINVWRRHGKVPQKMATHHEISPRDLAAWRRFLADNPELLQELKRKNPAGTAENIARRNRDWSKRNSR
jgi:hypothetical protein